MWKVTHIFNDKKHYLMIKTTIWVQYFTIFFLIENHLFIAIWFIPNMLQIATPLSPMQFYFFPKMINKSVQSMMAFKMGWRIPVLSSSSQS